MRLDREIKEIIIKGAAFVLLAGITAFYIVMVWENKIPYVTDINDYDEVYKYSAEDTEAPPYEE